MQKGLKIQTLDRFIFDDVYDFGADAACCCKTISLCETISLCTKYEYNDTARIHIASKPHEAHQDDNM